MTSHMTNVDDQTKKTDGDMKPVSAAVSSKVQDLMTEIAEVKKERRQSQGQGQHATSQGQMNETVID